MKEANTIKRDMPIMCVVGNPPYSGVSTNKGEWITGLIDDYKYVDGVHFGERKHWLNDDYVKFIRMSEHLIEKNGEGVLGFITNHGYLDNPTFRGMRWHLMQTFDKIYVLDLHGNAKKLEVTPEGKPDINVFDIQQGVAIIVAVKKQRGEAGPAKVVHGELWGTRAGKYTELTNGTSCNLIPEEIECLSPQYPFVPRRSNQRANYENGFKITEFLPVYSAGVVSMGDGFAVAQSNAELNENLRDLLTSEHDEGTIKAKYSLGKNYGPWILEQRDALRAALLEPVPIEYRPFDTRVTFFDNRVLWRWRDRVMKNVVRRKNLAVCFNRTIEQKRSFTDVFVFDKMIQHHSLSLKEVNYLAPLYLYPDEQDLDQTRRVNFDPKLWKQLQAKAAHPTHGAPDEVQTFDYIYGVLHCPAYRDTYAEFLKIDFPRIPWPASPDEFWDVSAKGAQLRQLHLMDPATIGPAPYPFKGEGDGTVDKPRFEDGKVWINATQYFDAAPPVSWDFYIGGYQPAQKWLKDRKGRELDFEDIKHYQRILKILSETDRIMRTITMTLKDSAPET